jgi:hypothetical protein
MNALIKVNMYSNHLFALDSKGIKDYILHVLKTQGITLKKAPNPRKYV